MKYILILLLVMILFCCEKQYYNHIIEIEVTYINGNVNKITSRLINHPGTVYFYIKDTCLFIQNGFLNSIECGIVMFVVTSHSIENCQKKRGKNER